MSGELRMLPPDQWVPGMRVVSKTFGTEYLLRYHRGETWFVTAPNERGAVTCFADTSALAWDAVPALYPDGHVPEEGDRAVWAASDDCLMPADGSSWTFDGYAWRRGGRRIGVGGTNGMAPLHDIAEPEPECVEDCAFLPGGGRYSSEWCESPNPDPDSNALCSRKPGHGGEYHIACGGSGHERHRWPQEAPEEPEKPAACAEPPRLPRTGTVVVRRSTHVGEEMRYTPQEAIAAYPSLPLTIFSEPNHSKIPGTHGPLRAHYEPDPDRCSHKWRGRCPTCLGKDYPMLGPGRGA